MNPWSVQLKFGQRQHQVAHAANTLILGIFGGPVDRRAVLAGVTHVSQQTITAGRGHIPLQEQPQEKVYHFLIGIAPVFTHELGRIGAPAETVVPSRKYPDTSAVQPQPYKPSPDNIKRPVPRTCPAAVLTL